MRLHRRSVAALVLFTALPLAVATQRAADRFDLVIAGGRVIDPESGLDAVPRPASRR